MRFNFEDFLKISWETLNCIWEKKNHSFYLTTEKIKFTITIFNFIFYASRFSEECMAVVEGRWKTYSKNNLFGAMLAGWSERDHRQEFKC